VEPLRRTAPELRAIEAELAAIEPIFHHPELGTTRARYEAMTEPQFWEVGASGRRYSREYVIGTLIDRYSRPYEERWTKDDFCCQQLAADLYLLTYTLTEGPRVTRRATLWRRAPDGWKIVYHQGTVVEPSAPDPAS
jgi:hypothetical protein